MPSSLKTTPSTQDAWLHNPVTGELVRFEAPSAGGHRVEGELWLQPGAAVARPHIHDSLTECFQVHAGEIALRVGGEERIVGPGDEVVAVPAGTIHDWWNAGDGVAKASVEVDASPSAGDAPASRFISFFEVLFSLAALGEVDPRGAPKPLWLAAVMREYRDVIRLASPPALVQAALLGPLATIARRAGRDPLTPGLHGRTAPCVIPDPGPAELAALLAEPVRRNPD